MTVKITLAILQKVAPTTKADILKQYVDPLNTVMEHFGISENKKRVAAFLSQLAVESANFTARIENLNYSAEGLVKTFKKYFPTVASTNGYARNPAKIANKVYANRMGNGPESSGDGFKFRGRGLIQLTGKINYSQFATACNLNLDETVTYLETVNGACSSAGWFWNVNKLDVYADKGDIVGLTKRINGGTGHLTERQQKYTAALKALG